jgi:hypothetical protein
MTAASAVLRVGSHAPVPLHGTPAVSADYRPGEVTIVLGHTRGGQPVTVTVGSLEWTEDLEDAARVAFAGGVVQAGMHLAVIR